MRPVILDNYDSFTWNIHHLVGSVCGKFPEIVPADQAAWPIFQNASHIILSPGPGLPEQAGLFLEVIREYHRHKPILGICLGLQAIYVFFGGRLKALEYPCHGKQMKVYPADTWDPLLEGLPENFRAGRYHSWVADPDPVPDELLVTGWDERGDIMSIRHKTFPVHGVQYHPESVLTPDGYLLMRNFLKMGI